MYDEDEKGTDEDEKGTDEKELVDEAEEELTDGDVKVMLLLSIHLLMVTTSMCLSILFLLASAMAIMDVLMSAFEITSFLLINPSYKVVAGSSP